VAGCACGCPSTFDLLTSFLASACLRLCRHSHAPLIAKHQQLFLSLALCIALGFPHTATCACHARKPPRPCTALTHPVLPPASSPPALHARFAPCRCWVRTWCWCRGSRTAWPEAPMSGATRCRTTSWGYGTAAGATRVSCWPACLPACVCVCVCACLAVRACGCLRFRRGAPYAAVSLSIQLHEHPAAPGQLQCAPGRPLPPPPPVLLTGVAALPAPLRVVQLRPETLKRGLRLRATCRAP
jgi:hypothetical protein